MNTNRVRSLPINRVALRRRLGFVFKCFVGLVLLVYVFRSQTRLNEVYTVVTGSNFVDFLIALGVYFLTKLQISVRTYIISRNYASHSFGKILKDLLIANFFNTILPVGSGEFYRIKRLSDNRSSFLESAAIVTLDRTFGLSAILTVGCVSCLGADAFKEIINPLFVVIPALVGVIAFFCIGRYLKTHIRHHRWIGKIQLLFTYCLDHPLQALAIYFFSIIIIVTLIISLFLLGRGIGLELSLIHFLRFYPFVLIVTLLPVSIGGLGVRELATISAFGIIGVSKAHCVSLGLMQYAMMVAVACIGLALFIGSNPSDGSLPSSE